MAIQIRRGTNAQWETSKSNIVAGEPAVATDTKRAFIGVSNGTYMELANIESVAPAFNESTTYNTGDVVTYQGLMYVAITETSGWFNNADWEQMSIGNMLSRFNEHLYDGYETATIEDTPLATFSDGAGDIAVKDLQVGIEAKQDLHGYAHPWVGGAGKNKLKITATSATVNGVTFTVNSDGSVTVNGTTTVSNSFWNLNYVANQLSIPTGVPINIGLYGKNLPSTLRIQAVGNSGVTTVTYGGTAEFGISNDSTLTSTSATNSTWVRLQIQDAGTTINNVTVYPFWCYSDNKMTAYEPYENICPITGWDSVKTYVSGKNILSTQNVANGSYGGISVTRNADGSLTLNGTASASTVVLGNISTGLYGASASQNDGTKHIPNGTWVASTGLSTNIGIALQIYGTNEKSGVGDLHLLTGAVSTTSARFTVDDTYRYNYVRLMVNAGTYNNVTVYPRIYSVDNWQDPYEQGKVNAYTSSLGSTRYGGVLDVTTGKLTIDRLRKTIGELDWYKGSSGTYSRFYTSAITNIKTPTSQSERVDIISDTYETATNFTQILSRDQCIAVNTTGAINITDSRYTNVSDFKTAMSSVEIVYPLATPTTSYITPTQVKTHYHDNNLWVDCGDVEVLVYRITRH